jgi:hypothetical protein
LHDRYENPILARLFTGPYWRAGHPDFYVGW